MATSTVSEALDGFWLPAHLRETVLNGAEWKIGWLKAGIWSDEPIADAVPVRWPLLTKDGWTALHAGLQNGRRLDSNEALRRWAMMLARLPAEASTTGSAFLSQVSIATGYSMAMLARALGSGDLAAAGELQAALCYRPTWQAMTRWESLPHLSGYLRFFPDSALRARAASLAPRQPIYRPAPHVDTVLGFAAGNVPGTAILMALLAACGNDRFDYKDRAADATPALLVRNSRHEPLFAPWVLSAVECHDPDLVAGIAVLIWDYTDRSLQARLLASAGLMLAAAGDDTIADLEAQRVRYAPACRFHQHGHKTSFSLIQDPAPELASRAALDSAFWDQNGCLSSRVHFVIGDAHRYAQQLCDALAHLAVSLPRGSTPRRFLHRAFDAFAALEEDNHDREVTVISAYDEEFVVVLDTRPWGAAELRSAVNVCKGRVVIVHPVDAWTDAVHLLHYLPPANLQSVSVALPHAQVLPFAQDAGRCGVTAIRPLGRAALPRLAYSWDGLLPLDMAYLRPAGHFTAIEFDPQDPLSPQRSGVTNAGA